MFSHHSEICSKNSNTDLCKQVIFGSKFRLNIHKNEELDGGSEISRIFFIKFLGDICVFVRPLIPLFWISADICPVFKARLDFLLAGFLACMLFLRFTFGATPANLLTASMAASHIPYKCFSAEVGCQDLNG